MLPKASKSYPKINEKSTSEPDFRDFCETMNFNDSIMVFLDFTGLDDL